LGKWGKYNFDHVYPVKAIHVNYSMIMIISSQKSNQTCLPDFTASGMINYLDSRPLFSFENEIKLTGLKGMSLLILQM